MGVLSRSTKNGGQGIPIALGSLSQSLIAPLILSFSAFKSFIPFYERGVTEIEVN